MNDDATINENGGKFAGMDRYAARAEIVKELDEMGLLVRIEDYTHNVGTHDRCKTVIEPMIKKQWFVKMDDLIKPATRISNLFPKDLKKHISTGRTISATGAYRVNFGGDTEYLHITVPNAERSLYANPKMHRPYARNADITE